MKLSAGTVFIGVFHVRDPKPVKAMLRSFRAHLAKKRGAKRSGSEPGPMHLVCDHHFVFVAPSRSSADALRDGLVDALGSAIEYVETRPVRIPPEAVRAARGAPRRARTHSRISFLPMKTVRPPKKTTSVRRSDGSG
jgi:hypothetical protein